MKRTNIVLDEELVERAMAATGLATRRGVVQLALERLVEQAATLKVLRDLRGTLRWEGDITAWRTSRGGRA